MRKHADTRVPVVPPDHLNTRLSSGLGIVIETMLAKNREHRYSTPDDLILDLKCLIQGESPMIAAQKPESLEAARPGRPRHRRGRRSEPGEEQMIEIAGIVNNRNQIIATIAMLLAVSVITNLILLTTR